MAEENTYIEQRKKKVAELREGGLNPYPQNIKPTHTTEQILKEFDAKSPEELEKSKQKISIAGRVIFIRSFGKAAFVKLKDRAGILQVYCEKPTLGDDSYKLFQT